MTSGADRSGARRGRRKGGGRRRRERNKNVSDSRMQRWTSLRDKTTVRYNVVLQDDDTPGTPYIYGRRRTEESALAFRAYHRLYLFNEKQISHTHRPRERTHSGLVALEQIYRSTRYIVRSEERMRSALPYRIVRREVPLAWITE